MKAIVHETYGSLDVLELKEIDRARPKSKEVLLRVRAAGLHIGDCFTVRGVPLPIRLAVGLRKPRHGIPGRDVAGEVEAVGDAVTRFQPGDEVFGTSNGSCAEYTCAREDRLVLKPASLTFEQAAAIPTSAVTALRAIRDVGAVESSRKVLINGASGGVGTFAVQIAASYGADVTGVCGPANADLLRSLGADHVIDYTRENFTTGERRYDLILDNVENHSLADCRRALAPTGPLIRNNGTGSLIQPLLLSPFTRQKLRRYIATSNRQHLAELTELIESGKPAPVVGKTYPLAETPGRPVPYRDRTRPRKGRHRPVARSSRTLKQFLQPLMAGRSGLGSHTPDHGHQGCGHPTSVEVEPEGHPAPADAERLDTHSGVRTHRPIHTLSRPTARRHVLGDLLGHTPLSTTDLPHGGEARANPIPLDADIHHVQLPLGELRGVDHVGEHLVRRPVDLDAVHKSAHVSSR
nr:NAD(P)-dependent alcohol dehydrogenase [Actinomadura sp. BRA 177]